jgi:hypothetical protein
MNNKRKKKAKTIEQRKNIEICKTPLTYKGKHIIITKHHSVETQKVREAENNIFQAPKENKYQPRQLYPTKLSFKINAEIKTF